MNLIIDVLDDDNNLNDSLNTLGEDIVQMYILRQMHMKMSTQDKTYKRHFR